MASGRFAEALARGGDGAEGVSTCGAPFCGICAHFPRLFFAVKLLGSMELFILEADFKKSDF